MEESKVTLTENTYSTKFAIPSEISNPVIQPTIPFMGPIPGGLKPDTAVFFQGAVPRNSKLIEINFHTGPNYTDGVAFHFNPRITNKYVYMNTYRNETWEEEECVHDKPITKGTSFSLLFVVKSEGYEVYVNGIYYHLYKHRIPLEQVKTLGIRGDVFISIFGYINNWSQSSLCAEKSKTSGLGSSFVKMLPIQTELSNLVINPSLPHTAPLTEGINPGVAFFFQGTFNPNGNQLSIDFRTGPKKTDDIQFTFNPRIDQYVYMNTFLNGSWQKEQLIEYKPFARGGTFSILIILRADCFEIHVNGQLHCTYVYRLFLGKITQIQIWGDACIHYFGNTYNFSRSPFYKMQVNPSNLSSSSMRILNVPSEVVNTVYQPKLPYMGPLEWLSPGMAVYIRGSVLTDDSQFGISFLSAKNWNADCHFTFNPRFDQYTYMNTYRNQQWEKEELFSGNFSFVRGANFIVIIVLKTEGYEVIVNGASHCFYKHRIPLKTIKALCMWGGFSILYFGLIQDWTGSSFFKEISKTAGVGSSSSGIFVTPTELSNVINQPDWTGSSFFKEISKTAGVGSSSSGIFVTPTELSNVIKQPDWTGSSFFKETSKTAGVKSSSSGIFVTPTELSNVIKQPDWTGSSFFKETSKTAGVGSSSSGIFVIPTELSNVIKQPTLPYVGPVFGEVKPGMGLYVEGTVPETANQFSINFCAGENKSDDVLMTFNPRFGQYLYLNSFRNGVWEKEQLVEIKPFSRKAAFNALICITTEGFEMYVNGKKHFTFPHCIPYDRFKTLNIFGDVNINFCGFLDNWRRSYIFRDQPKITDVGSSFSSLLPLPSEMTISNLQPTSPYRFLGIIRTDLAFFIHGILPAHAKSFEINFKSSDLVDDRNNEIMFQFNPRIGDGVYMNSYIAKSWGNEERVSDKPFVRGASFQLFIVIQTEGFQVFVNGVKYCMFKHRCPLEKFSSFSIVGDVSLLFVDYTYNWNGMTLSQSNTTVMGSLVSRPLSLPSSVTTPTVQPKSPYLRKLPGGLKENMAVFFQGTVPMNAKSFEINFKTDTDDIALQISPVDGEYVNISCFINGSWEKPAVTNASEFTRGTSFYMFIVVYSDKYEIYANGFRKAQFKHRISPVKVTTLGICGDISKLVYGVIDNWNTSYLCIDQSRITGIGQAYSSLLANPSELSHLVIQPSLPYLDKIPGGLKPDMAVYLQGAIPAHAVIFEINLQTGSAPEDDIAFHFSPRFISEHIYLNTVSNGNWGSNETASIKPLQKEATFEMFIVIKSEGYEVYLNGMFCCLYKHRLPLQNVCALSIYGDVSIPFYGFIDNWSKSSFIADGNKITSKGTQSLLPLPAEVVQPIIQPALPYVGSITEGLKPDMAVFFQGTIPDYAKSFEINFKTGPSDGDDIAFHFNPRIGQFVNLTSFQNGVWDKMEPTPEIPFFHGTALNMFVVISSEGYEVFVNGVTYCTFKHRIPVEKVSTLAIHGDLSLLVCGITNNWKTSPFCLGLSTALSTPPPKELSSVIRNPKLPYIADLQLNQNMAIYFQGTLPEKAKSFEIHLLTGMKFMADTALKFNPRIGKNISMSSLRNYAWENEETASDKPFSRGAAFQMILVITSKGYEIYINGLKHCVYKHRIPIQKVSVLSIFGDVYLSFFGFIDNWNISSFNPAPNMISFPINNLTLPYAGKIPGGIKPNTALIITGSLPENTKGFEVNFKTGPLNTDDVAFQFNPRIGQNIYLNSFRNGKWEMEESAPDSPFKKDGAFEITIVFKMEGYEVYVNTIKCCLFKHRIPLEKVSILSFGGNVCLNMCNQTENLNSLSFLSGSTTPTSAITIQKSDLSNTVYYPLKGKENMAVFFQGTVSKDGKGFKINFQSGQERNDIAFHFNPRMGRYTALNTRKNGSWGKQVTVAAMPFTVGGDFEIIISFKSEGYKVYVNSLSYCTYNHLIPFENVSAIDIQGDVIMNQVYFIEDWKTPATSKE